MNPVRTQKTSSYHRMIENVVSDSNIDQLKTERWVLTG